MSSLRLGALCGALVLTLLLAPRDASAEEAAPTVAAGVEPAPAGDRPAAAPQLEWKVRMAGQMLALSDFSPDQDLRPFGVAADEDLRFGIRRLSFFAEVSANRFVGLKAHLLSMPVLGQPAVDVADLFLTLNFDRAFNLHVGRMKKGFTEVFTPFWATWRFFDLPTSFKYATSNLGLAGRGEGVMALGSLRGGRLRYSAGVFNGLEEARPFTREGATFARSADSVELMGRLDLQAHEWVRLGAGAAWLPSSTSTATRMGADGVPAVTATEVGMVAYAANASFSAFGFDLVPEFIGHVVSEEQSRVSGGGLHVDALYEIAVPNGALRPGLRWARHYADFSRSEAYTEQYTAQLDWRYGKVLQLGLELSQTHQLPSGARDLQGLLKMVVVHSLASSI